MGPRGRFAARFMFWSVSPATCWLERTPRGPTPIDGCAWREQPSLVSGLSPIIHRELASPSVIICTVRMPSLSSGMPLTLERRAHESAHRSTDQPSGGHYCGPAPPPSLARRPSPILLLPRGTGADGGARGRKRDWRLLEEGKSTVSARMSDFGFPEVGT